MQEIDKNIEIVCVSNDLKTFEGVVSSNPNMNKYKITLFDNTVENIGIAKRYNSYIEQNITPKSDFWVVFCHQDFGFEEDPLKKIRKLSKKNIYGAIGVKIFFSLKRGLKGILSGKTGYYASCKIKLKGMFFKHIKTFDISKIEPSSGFLKRKVLGQIRQGTNNAEFKKFGKKIWFAENVSSLDCCCLIVHSSLIKKYNLRFDENLDWHMYVEDFCFAAKKRHRIQSKAVQFNCFHLGEGTLNDDFYKCSSYVKKKHSLKWLKTTCIDD